MKLTKGLTYALVLGFGFNLVAVTPAHAGLLIWGVMGGFHEHGQDYRLSNGQIGHVPGIPDVVRSATSEQLVVGGVLCGVFLELCALDEGAPEAHSFRVPTQSDLLDKGYSQADSDLIIRDAQIMHDRAQALGADGLKKLDQQFEGKSFAEEVRAIHPGASDQFIEYLSQEFFVPSSASREAVSDKAEKAASTGSEEALKQVEQKGSAEQLLAN